MISILDVREVASLKRAIRAGAKPDYLFFWGHRARRPGETGKWCLSQWWPAELEVDGIAYPTAEHFMMAEKARLFGDQDALEEILTAPTPAGAKNSGRQVRGFQADVWAEKRFSIVVRGNQAKFEQRAGERSFLLGTGERVLVEASPTDRVWGIGLAEDDPRAGKPDAWRGLNLLGFALMEVRSRLRASS